VTNILPKPTRYYTVHYKFKNAISHNNRRQYLEQWHVPVLSNFTGDQT